MGNKSPIANAQAISILKNTAKAVVLTGSDADGDSLTYTITSQPQNGTITGNTPNLTYTPNQNYLGSDSIKFKVNEGKVSSLEATVSITIADTDDTTKPNVTLGSINAAYEAGDKIIIAARASDDKNLQKVTFTIAKDGNTTPVHSKVWEGADITSNPFTPDPYLFDTSGLSAGLYHYALYAKDAADNLGEQGGTFTLSAVNSAPQANAQSVSVFKNTAKSITLTGSDADGDPLTYTVVSQPQNGTLTGNAPDLTYTPKQNYLGGDSIKFKVNDGKTSSVEAAITITVNEIPDTTKPTVVLGSIKAAHTIGDKIIIAARASDDKSLQKVTFTITKDGSTTPIHSKSWEGAEITSNPFEPAPYLFETVGLSSGLYHYALYAKDMADNLHNVGGTFTLNEPVNNLPTANAGADQEVVEELMVKLSGSGSDPDGDSFTYSWAQTGGTPSVNLIGADTATPSFTAPSVSADTTLTFTLTVTDSKAGTATDSVKVLLLDRPIVQPTPTGKLNDTGITLCGDYATGNSGKHNNDVPCSLLSDIDGDPVPPGQDGTSGRDVTHNDDNDGHAGFSFTKLDANGRALADQSADYATTPWACVKDSVTGLIWEVKTDDGGLHNKSWGYSWYEPDSSKNGRWAGVQDGGSCGDTSQCDTNAYVQAVNTVGWCGAKDWRLPTINELSSIINFDAVYPPLFNTVYFRNTANFYWSSSSIAGNAGNITDDTAWSISSSGYSTWQRKYSIHSVQLVRDGK